MAKDRFVQLYTWWTNHNGRRFFCVVEKLGKLTKVDRAGGQVEIWKTTDVKLIEWLNPNPVNYDIDKFWDLVDRSKLIEYIPGTSNLETLQKPPKEVPFFNPDNDLFDAISH